MFLGLPISAQLREMFDLPEWSLFNSYLEEIVLENSPYLGKKIPSPTTLAEVEQMQAHIVSLIERCFPAFSPPPLMLIGITSTQLQPC